MAKEINEKTFELNITNELLNLSKSFIWYLNHFHLLHFPYARNRNIISQFMKQTTLFAEGLTQKEESDKSTGGYDVSIKYNLPDGQEGRIMFLQFKAGIRKSHCNSSTSKFYRQTARTESRSSEHVFFTFNDAAKCTQHSTLRNLANTTDVGPNSVMYVFPRITEKSDFRSKVGNLVCYSSFVPVIEIDNQAAPKAILDGVAHKYRTSYDGLTSEVNFFFFFFFYDNKILSELLSELICIQIERFAKLLIKENKPDLEIFLDVLSDSFNNFIEYELKFYPANDLLSTQVYSYINSVREYYRSNSSIPIAPSKYTTVVPKEGLKLKLEAKIDFSEINYQMF